MCSDRQKSTVHFSHLHTLKGSSRVSFQIRRFRKCKNKTEHHLSSCKFYTSHSFCNVLLLFLPVLLKKDFKILLRGLVIICHVSFITQSTAGVISAYRHTKCLLINCFRIPCILCLMVCQITVLMFPRSQLVVPYAAYPVPMGNSSFPIYGASEFLRNLP